MSIIRKFVPQTIQLWEVKGRGLEEVEKRDIELERWLEDLLEQDISVISNDLLVIGRQVVTAFGKAVDLLCLNSEGDVVIVELKRGEAPREAIAQALEYASWVDDLSYEDVVNIANDYLKKRGLTIKDAFREKFDGQLPDVLNEAHEILIVATGLDDQSERVIEYLSQHGIRINAIILNYFKTKDGREFLAKTQLIPESMERERKGEKRTPSDEELKAVVEERGVGELFSVLFDGLSRLFDDKRKKYDLVTFYGRQDGRLNAIFRIDLSQSDEQKGLVFQVYMTRLAKYLNITEQDCKKLLPADVREWRLYASAPPEYSGCEGSFKDKKEVEAFLSRLQELKGKVARK